MKHVHPHPHPSPRSPRRDPRHSRLLVAACLLAFWAGLCIALSGCGGGGSDSPCLDTVERITLADGREVLAPHNCLPQ